MQNSLATFGFTFFTAICWGVYGPTLKQGVDAMTGSDTNLRMRAFIGVGLAYFLLAVVIPIMWLSFKGEKGGWTTKGLCWSLTAGTAGAIGALGLILALGFGGSPIYVMPLVFGGAPVVNTFTTMYMGKSSTQAGPLFYAGLILVLIGALTVLVTRPGQAAAALGVVDSALVFLSIALTVACWGVYGPFLHLGQAAMQGSRLRPLLCVGLAYFLIAVVLPYLHLLHYPDEGDFTAVGMKWSVAAGSAGALGAIGLILAFTFGGKPIFVMPLVFGLAPVINTLISLKSFGSVGPLFFAGLIIVIAGAMTVLVFAPRGGHAPPVKSP
jgi:hypothetical protein